MYQTERQNESYFRALNIVWSTLKTIFQKIVWKQNPTGMWFIEKYLSRYNNSIFGWAGHTKEGKTFSNVSGQFRSPVLPLSISLLLVLFLVGFRNMDWVIQLDSQSGRKSPCRAMMDATYCSEALIWDITISTADEIFFLSTHPMFAVMYIRCCIGQ